MRSIATNKIKQRSKQTAVANEFNCSVQHRYHEKLKNRESKQQRDNLPRPLHVPPFLHAGEVTI
jgi:hypothetical protein